MLVTAITIYVAILSIKEVMSIIMTLKTRSEMETIFNQAIYELKKSHLSKNGKEK